MQCKPGKVLWSFLWDEKNATSQLFSPDRWFNSICIFSNRRLGAFATLWGVNFEVSAFRNRGTKGENLNWMCCNFENVWFGSRSWVWWFDRSDFFFMGFINHWFFHQFFYFFCVFAICFVQLFFSANPLKSTPEKINQTKQNTCTPKLVLCFWQLGGRCSHCCPWNLLRSWFLIYLLNKKLVQETMRLAFMSTINSFITLLYMYFPPCFQQLHKCYYIPTHSNWLDWTMELISLRWAKRDGHRRSWWVLTGWFVYRLYS